MRSNLEIYLQDHLAGAAMGAELTAKMGADHDNASLAALAREVEEDKAALAALVQRLGFSPDPLKQAAGWAAEKVSRLTLTDSGAKNFDLKRLLELEVMSLGVEGKLALWNSLLEVCDHHPELDGTELAMLAKRAEGQRHMLEDLRRAAARSALAA